MRPEQKVVAIGAASGVLTMVVLVWLLTQWLPAPTGIETPGERVAYALRINLVALVPFFIMIITIANSRFMSDAIDPTLKAETTAQLIDGRVADNTLQQNFVFAVASLALATVLDARHLHDRAARVLVRVSRASAVSRARHVGHRIPEPRHDPVRPVCHRLRQVTVA